MRTATAVWKISPALVTALAERLGEPLDAYVNGTQTWLTPDGPNGATLEWRLHPVGGYRAPGGVSHYDLWELALGALPAPLRVGDEERPVESLWGGLECFPAYGDEVEPSPLAAAATDVLGVAPDASGLVDHQRIGDVWERSRGALDLVDALLDALAGEAR